MKRQTQTYNGNSLLKSAPFFSIIITTYNRADLLKRAVHSLLAQTEKDWEAIIIDDGSTDHTYSRILSYIIGHHNISYHTRLHKGEAISKNAGICLSKGRYVSFLDSDDEYAPDHLVTRKNILTEKSSVDFLYGGVAIIGNQFVPDRSSEGKLIHLKDCVIGGTFFVRRELIHSLNGFRKIFLGTDADLFERIKAVNANMMETNLPTYVYHHETEDSITNRLLEQFKT